MAASSDLFAIDPPELQFPFELNKQISCPLKLTNKTDDYVAFKVKTTSPKKYCVRPNNGVVLPRSSCVVVGNVLLQASRVQETGNFITIFDPKWRISMSFLGSVTMQAQLEAPPDMQCKDKFLVQSVVVREGLSAKDITPQMFAKEEGNVVEEVKLKVAYVPPPESLLEGTEAIDSFEGVAAPKVEIMDNGQRSASELSCGSESLRSVEPGAEVGSCVGRVIRSDELLKTVEPAVETIAYVRSGGQPLEETKAYVGPGAQSLETSTSIARLTEEKNSVLEQNKKLQAELDLLRRGVRNQQGGFSLIFVVVVTLISIILGYVVKK